MSATHVLAIDQGTTSSRAIVFDAGGKAISTAQRELTQHFPADGWVEHDANEIWRDTLEVSQSAIAQTGQGADAIAAIGITNQRETTVIWDRATGEPIHKAIVWQDRRTAGICRELAAEGLGDHVTATTGLLIDAYFSATKIAWLLDHVEGARARAERGELCFGTIDSFLLFKLTGGRVHASDASNAARTMVYDIGKGDWDDVLLKRLGIPREMMPVVQDNSGLFGETDPALFGRSLPVMGMAGDQQAATFGQACFAPGMLKSTYGTGCFALLNTGAAQTASRNRLLTTIAYRLNGKTTYAIEGSIFIAGAAMQWVRDGLKAVSDASESEAIAASLPDTGGVYLVPAFTGLGAPYWDPDARGAILGLTRDSGQPHIVRAALESVCYQTADLMSAMASDVSAAGGSGLPAALRVDGGMVANNWVCQYLADILDCPVERPKVIETTALGAAYLAGMAAGVYAGTEQVAAAWQLDRRFEPSMSSDLRGQRLAGWADAVARVRSNSSN